MKLCKLVNCQELFLRREVLLGQDQIKHFIEWNKIYIHYWSYISNTVWDKNKCACNLLNKIKYWFTWVCSDFSLICWLVGGSKLRLLAKKDRSIRNYCDSRISFPACSTCPLPNVLRVFASARLFFTSRISAVRLFTLFVTHSLLSCKPVLEFQKR